MTVVARSGLRMPPGFGRIHWLRLFAWSIALVTLVPRLGELPVHVEKDPNEGWNAIWADRVAHGESIYFPSDQLLANNYPPLSFHLLALAPDPLIAGRWVALAGLLATGAGVGWIARRTGGDGWVAAALLVSFVACHHSGYVAMNDPQWLAHAVMTSALVWLVARRGSGWSAPAGALAMLLAGLIKHSLIPLPLAVTWWLWHENRSAFWRWLGAAVAGLLASLVVLRAAYGRECLDNILATPRAYSWAAAAQSVARWSVVAVPLLAVAWCGFKQQQDSGWRRLIVAYLLIALAWAAFTLGGDGVDRNVCFDAVIAATLAASWALARAERRAWAWCVPAAFASLIVVAPTRWRERGILRQHEAAWAADIAWLKTQPGTVAAQQLGLVHWSGHLAVTDNFLLSQRLQARALSPERVIDAGVDVWVIPPTKDWPLAGQSLERLLRNYDRVRDSENGTFFVRKRAGRLSNE